MNNLTNLTELHDTLHKVVYRMLETVSIRSFSGNFYITHDYVKDLISFEDYLLYKEFIYDLLLTHEAVQEVDYDDTEKEYSITLYRSFVRDYPDAEAEGISSFNEIEYPLVANATYNGKTYSFTKEELEAAYRLRLRQYAEEDCLRHLHNLIWDVDDFSELGIEPEEDEAGADFASEYGATIPEIEALVPTFVNHYQNNFDCSVDENAQWRNTIEMVLSRLNDVREREAKANGTNRDDDSVFNRIRFCGMASTSASKALNYLCNFVEGADSDAVSFMINAAERQGDKLALFGRGSCLDQILDRFGFYTNEFGQMLVKEF